MAISENDKIQAYHTWSQKKQGEMLKLNQAIQAQIKDFNLRAQINFFTQQLENLSELAKIHEVRNDDKLTKEILGNLAGFKTTLAEMNTFEAKSKINIKTDRDPSHSRIDIKIPLENEIEGKEMPLTRGQRVANFFISIARIFGSKTPLYVPKIEKYYTTVQTRIDEKLQAAQLDLNTFMALKLKALHAGFQVKALIDHLQNKKPPIESLDVQIARNANAHENAPSARDSSVTSELSAASEAPLAVPAAPLAPEAPIAPADPEMPSVTAARVLPPSKSQPPHTSGALNAGLSQILKRRAAIEEEDDDEDSDIDAELGNSAHENDLNNPAPATSPKPLSVMGTVLQKPGSKPEKIIPENRGDLLKAIQKGAQLKKVNKTIDQKPIAPQQGLFKGIHLPNRFRSNSTDSVRNRHDSFMDDQSPSPDQPKSPRPSVGKK